MSLPQTVAFSPRVSSSSQKPSSLSTDDAILSRTFRRHDDQPEQKTNTQDKLNDFSRAFQGLLNFSRINSPKFKDFQGHFSKISNLTRTPSKIYTHFKGSF